MTNPTSPYAAFDLGRDIRNGVFMFQVKTCKSRRHQYYGTNRCPACKRDYDRRYHKMRRDEAKRRKFTFRHPGAFTNMPMPPIKFVSMTGTP